MGFHLIPQQVIGSQFQLKFEKSRNGKVALMRTRKLSEPLNLNAGKPINIHKMIGKIPVIAVGNSDGDLEMLQYASSNSFPSLEVLIHHDDSSREVAYDQGAEKILAEAQKKNWVTVSMKNDFNRTFAIRDQQIQK